jgi:hypothetical protein
MKAQMTASMAILLGVLFFSAPSAHADCDCKFANGRCFVAGTGDCGPTAEKSGLLCYDKCRAGYSGVGPVCWENCRAGYHDDGLTCRKDAWIFGSNNSACPWYDICGLTFAKGCSTCPGGFHNDGCTCRRDVDIYGKGAYGRGAGYLLRFGAVGYRGLFYRYIQDHRNIWWPSASPLRDSEKAFLRRFFPDRIVNKVRVVELLGMTGAFNFSADATTYGELIVIKQGKRSNNILKHEMVHVCQYDRFGVRGFAERYADMYVDSGYGYGRNMCFEDQAYQYQSLPDATTPRVGTFLGYCNN